MARYTLKTYSNQKLLERFDHRSPAKLERILAHPRYSRVVAPNQWDENQENPTRFEIFDSVMEKLFDGNINLAEIFVKSLP
jgi:hypothetical protein